MAVADGRHQADAVMGPMPNRVWRTARERIGAHVYFDLVFVLERLGLQSRGVLQEVSVTGGHSGWEFPSSCGKPAVHFTGAKRQHVPELGQQPRSRFSVAVRSSRTPGAHGAE